MSRGLERALNECLSQLNTDELGLPLLEEALARCPEHEAELRPLLRTAMLVRQTPQVVPSPEARAAGRRRLLAAVAKKRREKAPARVGLLRRLGQSAATLVQPWVQLPLVNNKRTQPLRLAQAMAAVLVIVSLVSAGTVGVAADSLPDSPLYTIKRATERVQLALTTTAAGQARLHMDYSKKRLDEAQSLWEAGKGLYEMTLWDIESEYNGALAAINQVPDEQMRSLLDDFNMLTARQQVLLEEMKPGMPPAEKEAVEKALETSAEYQSLATEAMTEPDLLLTPRPPDTAALAMPTSTATPVPPTFTQIPVPTATPAPPTFTPIPVPTATPVPPTFTPIPVPTATPAPPTFTPIPVPTATPAPPTPTETSQAHVPVPVQPTLTPMEPTPMATPEAVVPVQPTTVEPVIEPTPTFTSTPTP